MAKKTIPAQYVFTCDRCKKESSNLDFLTIKIELPGRDMLGDVVSQGPVFEICRKCENDLLEFLTKYTESK
jgi:hypothetical protein